MNSFILAWHRSACHWSRTPVDIDALGHSWRRYASSPTKCSIAGIQLGPLPLEQTSATQSRVRVTFITSWPYDPCPSSLRLRFRSLFNLTDPFAKGRCSAHSLHGLFIDRSADLALTYCGPVFRTHADKTFASALIDVMCCLHCYPRS